MMTKKNYVAIAAAIKASHTDAETSIVLPERERTGVAIAAQSIAKALAADNPHFDHPRFLRACGF